LGRPDLKVRKFPGKNKIFQSGKREFWLEDDNYDITKQMNAINSYFQNTVGTGKDNKQCHTKTSWRRSKLEWSWQS
jgi:hypothetical protein